MNEKSYFYIDNDGKQQGPRLLSQLKADRVIYRSTLVWCDGMGDWQTAYSVEDFNNFWFDNNQPPIFPPPLTNKRNEQETKPIEPDSEMPHTWLIESIVTTILLCYITGIIGIIYSLKVESNWKKGRYEEAHSAAKIAKIMFFISIAWIVLGVLAVAFCLLPVFLCLVY